MKNTPFTKFAHRTFLASFSSDEGSNVTGGFHVSGRQADARAAAGRNTEAVARIDGSRKNRSFVIVRVVPQNFDAPGCTGKHGGRTQYTKGDFHISGVIKQREQPKQIFREQENGRRHGIPVDVSYSLLSSRSLKDQTYHIQIIIRVGIEFSGQPEHRLVAAADDHHGPNIPLTGTGSDGLPLNGFSIIVKADPG